MRNRSIHNFRAFNSGISITITPLNITIIIRSVYTKKIGNEVSAYLADHIVTVVDPQSSFNGYFVRLVNKAYFYYKEGGHLPNLLEATVEVFWRADAYLVCTPEMKKIIALALMNMMTYFGSSVFVENL